MESSIIRKAKYGDRLFLVYKDPDDEKKYQIDEVKVVWEPADPDSARCSLGVILISFFRDQSIWFLHDGQHEGAEATDDSGLAGIFASMDDAAFYISNLKK